MLYNEFYCVLTKRSFPQCPLSRDTEGDQILKIYILSMTSELDNFYLSKTEPLKSTFLALRQIIKQYDQYLIRETWKYKLPFFEYKGKMFCYLWKDKKTNQPYIGIANGYLIDHPTLFQGDRKRMKIFPIDTDRDIPIEDLYAVFDLAVQTYK